MFQTLLAVDGCNLQEASTSVHFTQCISRQDPGCSNVQFVFTRNTQLFMSKLSGFNLYWMRRHSTGWSTSLLPCLISSTMFNSSLSLHKNSKNCQCTWSFALNLCAFSAETSFHWCCTWAQFVLQCVCEQAVHVGDPAKWTANGNEWQSWSIFDPKHFCVDPHECRQVFW